MPTDEGPSGERALPEVDPVEALAELEAQAAAWSREEREVEVVDRAVEAYRSVTLASRLVASLDRSVTLDMGLAGRVHGRLAAAGDGWALVAEPGGREVLVMTAAVTGVRGASEAAAPAGAWPLSSRIGPGAALLRQVGGSGQTVLALRDGETRRGRVRRLGADFVELLDEEESSALIALGSVAIVRCA